MRCRGGGRANKSVMMILVVVVVVLIIREEVHFIDDGSLLIRGAKVDLEWDCGGAVVVIGGVVNFVVHVIGTKFLVVVVVVVVFVVFRKRVENNWLMVEEAAPNWI